MKTPDTDAIRKRRQRAHQRGDHNGCLPGNCSHAQGDTPPGFVIPASGSIESAVLDFVDQLKPGRNDGPQIVMARVAVRLARDLDGQPSNMAGVSRELQNVMQHLGDTWQDEDRLSEIRARAAERRSAILDGDDAA